MFAHPVEAMIRSIPLIKTAEPSKSYFGIQEKKAAEFTLP